MSIEGKKNSWVVKNFHKKRNYTIRSGSYFLVVCCRSESGAGRHFVALCSPGQWVLGRLPKLVPQPGQEQGPSCSLSGDIQTYILGKGMNSISFCWLVYALYVYKKHDCYKICTLYMHNTSYIFLVGYTLIYAMFSSGHSLEYLHRLSMMFIVWITIWFHRRTKFGKIKVSNTYKHMD